MRRDFRADHILLQRLQPRMREDWWKRLLATTRWENTPLDQSERRPRACMWADARSMETLGAQGLG